MPNDNENRFVVDLGELKLTEEQRSRINAAIQQAVATSLTGIIAPERGIIAPEKQMVFLPIGRRTGGPLGPFINGVIVREISDKKAQELLMHDLKKA